MRGDALARGAKSATFPSLSHVSQQKWNDIFGEASEPQRKIAKSGAKKKKKV
jgi:hypothetical protein